MHASVRTHPEKYVFVPKVNWDKVTLDQLSFFRDSISNSLPVLSQDVVSCVDPMCKAHLSDIDTFLNSFIDCIASTSQRSLTCIQ